MELSGKRMYSLLKKLDFERLSTTEGEKRGAQIIADEISKLGIEPKIETFMAPRYEVTKVKFEITAPFKREYAVTGYGFSGSTPKKGIEADFYYLESFDEMSLAEAKGKIVFVPGGIGVENFRKLAKSGALAFVSTSGTWLDKKNETDIEERMLRPVHTEDGVIPGVCMRMTDGIKLINSAPKKAKITLIQTQGEAESQNVICEIPGTVHPEDVIVFTSHYDSVRFSHGMFDNASGTVNNLEMLRYFAKFPPNRTMRFIFTGSEERGLLGSKAYVAAHKEELENIRLCINVDMTGPILGLDTALVMADMSLCHALDFYKKEIGFIMEVKQDIYSSDAIPFADNGVPGINFFRRATADSTKIHCRYDIISTVTAKSLARTAGFILDFTKKLDTAVYFPVDRKVPTEITEKVDKYLRKNPQK